MVQINGPAISVWISWIVIILTSQDTWSHVSFSTVEKWYILEGCTKWSPGTAVMYSNRLCWLTPGCRYSWFTFEGCGTFKWDIKWHRRLKHCWLCGETGTFTGGRARLSLWSLHVLSSSWASKCASVCHLSIHLSSLYLSTISLSIYRVDMYIISWLFLASFGKETHFSRGPNPLP